jgi:hypothetical protein
MDTDEPDNKPKIVTTEDTENTDKKKLLSPCGRG